MSRKIHINCLAAVVVLGYASCVSASSYCQTGQHLVKITGVGNTNVLVNDSLSYVPASLGTTTINSDDGSIELICAVRGEILGTTYPIPFTTYIQCRDKLHSEVILHTELNPDPNNPPYGFIEKTVGIEGNRGIFYGVTTGEVTIQGTAIQTLQNWNVKGNICIANNQNNQ
jgi:hypothetical protein